MAEGSANEQVSRPQRLITRSIRTFHNRPIFEFDRWLMPSHTGPLQSVRCPAPAWSKEKRHFFHQIFTQRVAENPLLCPLPRHGGKSRKILCPRMALNVCYGRGFAPDACGRYWLSPIGRDLIRLGPLWCRTPRTYACEFQDSCRSPYLRS